MRATLLMLGLAAALTTAPAAAMMLPVPLDKAARGADAVVHARVLDKLSALDPQTRLIHTDVTLEVLETWKGALTKDSRITVRVMGGIVGDLGMRQEHEPSFDIAEECVLFLEARGAAPWRVHALEQGKFNVKSGIAQDLSGQRLMLSDFKTSVARFLRAPGN